MTTMIEKVAQAIADAQIGYERDRVSRGLASGKAAEHWEPATMRWDLMARAAIEAMMEPTVEMIDRGCVARIGLYPAYEGEKPQPTAGDVASTCYQAMIQAALKE